MKDIFSRIFTEYDFKSKNNEDNFRLFYKEKREYYIHSDYTKDEFLSFFECEKTKNLIDYFDYIKKDEDDIEKNTSLLITVKLDNIKEDYESIKNHIFKIEEDEYFFRKYVLIYDENMMKIEFAKDESLHSQFQYLIKQIDLKEFKKNKFSNIKNFLVMQMFVKLPFYSLNKSDEEYHVFEDLFDAYLIEKNLYNLNKYILEDTEELINELGNLDFLSEDLENEKVTEFFEKFRGIIE